MLHLTGGGFDVGRDFPGGGPFIDDISSWKNENFDIDHNGAGWVSMANVGKDTLEALRCKSMVKTAQYTSLIC